MLKKEESYMVVTDRPSYSAAVLRGDVPGPQELMTSILGVKVMKREEIIQEMTTRYGFVRECAEDICHSTLRDLVADGILDRHKRGYYRVV